MIVFTILKMTQQVRNLFKDVNATTGYTFDEYFNEKRHIKFLAAGMATALTSMGVAAGVGGVRSLSENMNWKDMFVSNTTRLKQLLSDKEEWKVTDKRMISLLDKLESIDPAYPDQCDHIDVENKHLAS